MNAVDADAETRAKAYSTPLSEINVADPELWRTDTVWPYFQRLRDEDPVHRHPDDHHRAGGFWSVTRFNDIVAVDTNHEAFSSDPIITLDEQLDGFKLPMFIAMDPPKHDIQRKTISPIVSPQSLGLMESVIRARVGETLDGLPIGEPFDWVDRVSIELTGQMLATLFDFPFEDRRKLTFWSDMATAEPDSELFKTTDPDAEFMAVMSECGEYFSRLWNERVNVAPKGDLISMLAHGPETRNMNPMEFLGNVILLIVGGNDTTRNTMSASVHELDRNPEQRTMLYQNPALIASMVSETLRWQTPLAYMRRTATRDVELSGKTIHKGEKVAMWYASGNRDESVIEDPDNYIINRTNSRRHLAFGFGIHRCVGNRLAELQMKILWEEIMRRFPEINIVGKPERVRSSFVRGFAKLQAVIPRRF